MPFDAAMSIPLTKGLFAVVDAADFERLSQHRWQAMKSKNTFYAARSVIVAGRKKTIRMHREILKVPAGVLVDHRDRNGLNNRRQNLRAATHTQNQANAVKRATGTQYRGVHAKRGRFAAKIRCDRVQHWLGAHTDPADAARAYDRKARELFGEFASLNFPMEA